MRVIQNGVIVNFREATAKLRLQMSGITNSPSVFRELAKEKLFASRIMTP